MQDVKSKPDLVLTHVDAEICSPVELIVSKKWMCRQLRKLGYSDVLYNRKTSIQPAVCAPQGSTLWSGLSWGFPSWSAPRSSSTTPTSGSWTAPWEFSSDSSSWHMVSSKSSGHSPSCFAYAIYTPSLFLSLSLTHSIYLYVYMLVIFSTHQLVHLKNDASQVLFLKGQDEVFKCIFVVLTSIIFGFLNILSEA